MTSARPSAPVTGTSRQKQATPKAVSAFLHPLQINRGCSVHSDILSLTVPCDAVLSTDARSPCTSIWIIPRPSTKKAEAFLHRSAEPLRCRHAPPEPRFSRAAPALYSTRYCRCPVIRFSRANDLEKPRHRQPTRPPRPLEPPRPFDVTCLRSANSYGIYYFVCASDDGD